MKIYIYRPDKAGDERKYSLDLNYLFTPKNNRYNPRIEEEEQRIRERIEEIKFKKRVQRQRIWIEV